MAANLEWDGLKAFSDRGTYEVKREDAADEGEAWIFTVDGKESELEYFTPELAAKAAEEHYAKA